MLVCKEGSVHLLCRENATHPSPCWPGTTVTLRLLPQLGNNCSQMEAPADLRLPSLREAEVSMHQDDLGESLLSYNGGPGD